MSPARCTSRSSATIISCTKAASRSLRRPVRSSSYQGYTVDDDTSGESNGNDNGIVNAGETIELPVTLENVGSDPAANVRATLSTASGFVVITDDYEEFGGIPADGTALSGDDYTVAISSAAPDGEVVSFDLSILSDDKASLAVRVLGPGIGAGACLHEP